MTPLMITVTTVFGAGAILLAVPTFVLLVEALLSMWPRPPQLVASPRRPRIAVLIPAHDESTGMLPTLRAVLPQLLTHDRCLVVADNCSDDTARVAALEGAEVVERDDPALRGKGYALDYGLRALAADAPEIVIVVDADCMVEDGALTRLATSCAQTGRPVQALYLMRTPPGAKGRIAEFAWRVKNWARPLGLHRVGLPCELMGTGMAFPWSALAGVKIASGHIAEDMKLGVDLAKTGRPPLFCPEAVVWSTFAANAKGADTQRTRWEHGHLSLIVKDMPALLGVGLRRFDFRLVAMALDLLVPPTALLAMLVVAWWVVTTALALLLPMPAWPVVLATLDGFAFFAAITIMWLHYGRSIVPFSAIVATALYALKKLPLYTRFLVNRQAEWVRSQRDEH